MVNVVKPEEKGTLQLQLTGLHPGMLVVAEVIGNHFKTSLPISVNQTRDVRVKPGGYLVRAYLPSGETIS